MADYEIDVPESLLPDLAELGIDEVDRGVCEDSFENRRILRANKFQWRPLYNENGEPTTLIQVHSSDMLAARAGMLLEGKKALLVNPKDKNSDYISGYDLILEPRAEEMVPLWVLVTARKWLTVEDRRELEGKNVVPSLAGPPGRCSQILSTNVRCQYWHGGRVSEMVGDKSYCRVHLGRQNVPSNVMEKARARLLSSVLGMAENLEDLALTADSEQVRLKATTEMMDRAGLRGGVEVDHTVTEGARDAGSLLAERLKNLKPKQKEIESTDESEIVDAEIVEDGDSK